VVGDVDALRTQLPPQFDTARPRGTHRRPSSQIERPRTPSLRRPTSRRVVTHTPAVVRASATNS
jgi:hypothetical protein